MDTNVGCQGVGWVGRPWGLLCGVFSELSEKDSGDFVRRTLWL